MKPSVSAISVVHSVSSTISLFLILSYFSSVLSGCEALPKPTKPKPLPIPDYSYREEARPDLAKRMPWELWQPFQDLEGRPISNRQLILGDELQERGKRASALDAYLSASSEALSASEGEATTLRIASQYLALDQAKDALKTTGSYFKRRGVGETDVPLPFGLILAFAYGRHGDVDQSFAWFSKVASQGRPGGPAIKVADTGVSLLLKTLPEEEFARIAVKWQGDTFINRQVGRERLRRASANYDPDDYRSDRPFWSWFEPQAASQPRASGDAGKPTIGLLVSLSDRYAALGRHTKQGFELAVDANNQGLSSAFKIEVRDVGSDPSSAAAAVRELASASGVRAIAGPLLSEPAVAAAQTAQELGVPLVSFSKSEAFTTGRGVFRLGATSSSQMEALVSAAARDYGISRFAVVYPQSANGTELLEAFRKKVTGLGLTLELELSYAASDDTSLIDIARQLEGCSAEGFLIADNIDVSERLLRNLSPEVKKKMRPLGSALWDNAQKIARSQALFERSIFVTPFFAQSTREEVVKFIESYKARYSVTPNFLAAQGFDAGTVIMNAAQASVSNGGGFEALLLRSPPYRGVTGVITVAQNGEFVRSFYVVEVLRDSFQERMPTAVDQAVGLSGQRGSSIERNTNTPVIGASERVDSGY
jgi:branched-chain amino acid transport system substrate-binding protein